MTLLLLFGQPATAPAPSIPGVTLTAPNRPLAAAASERTTTVAAPERTSTISVKNGVRDG